MCNYYCVYLKNVKSAKAYSDFLRANALANRVQFVLYPKLSELPDVFKKHQFGLKYPNFLGILYFASDAAVFPRELFEWQGVILDHLYTQESEAEDYFKSKVIRIMRAPIKRSSVGREMPVYVLPKRRVWHEEGETMVESAYCRVMDEYYKEEEELESLYAVHKQRVRLWKKAHADELRKKEADRKRLDSAMRDFIYPLVKRLYDMYKARNPGMGQLQYDEYYKALFDQKLKEARYHPMFKYPMDRIEQFFATRPEMSEELKEMIKLHEERGKVLEDLERKVKSIRDERSLY